MTKKLKIYMPEGLYNKTKAQAEATGMSMSSLICTCLSTSIPDDSLEKVSDNAEDNDRITIILRDKDALTLRERARKYGLSPTAFIRNAVLNQKMTIIQIDRSDERDLGNALREYESSLSKILKELKETSSPAEFNNYQRKIDANLNELAGVLTRYCNKISKRKDVKVRKIMEDLNGD